MNENLIILPKGNRDSDIIQSIEKIISGEVNAVWIREFSDNKTCHSISTAFQNTGTAQPRKDNVPGIMVGESHYFKTPDEYHNSCKHQENLVKSLFSTTEDPIERLYSIINDNIKPTRPARWKESLALHTRAISWKEKEGSQFLLQPHDDVSQVHCARNAGWEICNVKELIAVNFYAKCTPGHGALRLFDIRHTEQLEKEAGVTGVGYPYPDYLLQGVSSYDFNVGTGDVLMINGSLIHAVMPSEHDRIVLNSFIGVTPQEEVIYWT